MSRFIWLAIDRLLYRRPFEGRAARRYAVDERPAFGDLDDRLLDDLEPWMRGTLLELGAGPATFARRAAERFPNVSVIALDPSRDFAGHPGITIARAAGEALPLPDRSVDIAVCLSSIRHVRDRLATLRELRRVVRDRLVIVELDPTASAARIAAHADRLGSAILRAAFGPLVVRTAPRVEEIEDLAIGVGWHRDVLRDDPIQPVYVLQLS